MRRLPSRWMPLVLLLLLGVVPQAAAEEPRASEVYERRRTDIAHAVEWVAREARRRGVGQVLFVFDAVTFAPPPGVTEFSMDRLYPDDLPTWLDALGKQASKMGCGIRATSSLAPRTVDVGTGAWRTELEEIVRVPWWDGDRLQKFEPALRWINRLLAVTESAIGETSGEDRRMLVLVTGTVTPERWVFLGTRPGWESSWRTRLRDIGTYWDAEAISARLQRDACLFYAIAPEAHFCDFRPFVELPELPWAARPMFPPMRFGDRSGRGPTTASDEFDEADARRRIEEHLRPHLPDPEALEREVARQLRAMREAWTRTRGPEGRRRRPPTTPGPLPPGGGPPSLHETGWRFDSKTPLWFPQTDQTLLFNNHAPSGYGSWPLARVAGKTGGRYFFYPFPPTRWLDRCPYDPHLLDRLAPDLVHPAAYLGALKGDRALEALTRAANLVIDETPWVDGFGNQRTASGWSSFLHGQPLRFQPDWFLRRKPFEVVFEYPGDARRSLLRTGGRILDDVLPLYDRAIAILDRALVEEATSARKSHPRCVADLVLARYWFAMSAFHLEAFAIYAREIERFIPQDLDGTIDRWWVVYVPTIKMSDCLDGYDGRKLAPEDEDRTPRWVLPNQPGMQGNILLIDPEHPDYRAQRRLGHVLENLDPRLRRRALDMIHAARRVMKDYARSGWGWTTYYSIAYTFIFRPLPRGEGPPPMRPGGKEPAPPTTPQGPATTPGGSEPGGPASGG